MEKKVSQSFCIMQKVLKRARFYIPLLFLWGISMNLSAHNSIFKQSYTLNLSFNNTSIEKILDAISQQSGIKIAYSNDEVIANKKISIHIKTSSLQQALSEVLGDQYVFKQIEDYIVIAKKNELPKSANFPVTFQKKTRQIEGLITDAEGNPIIGVTVIVKGTTNGVTTDMDGRYTLKNVKPGDIIEFRYIGYNTEEKTLKNETTINLRMTESSVNLDDVVVIGYGQQKKASVVSSLNSIGASELNIKQRNLRNSIAGQIAGVIAVQRSGEPGNDAAAFYIRGQSSYIGGTAPLILVDGIPRAMDDIDVDEIESFTVLKDAAATAVYGAEGANGVVLITSKRGTSQKTKVNFTAQYSMVKPTRMPKLMDAYTYLSLYNEALWNDQGNPDQALFIPETSEEILEKYRTGIDPDLYPSVNWMDLMSDQTHNQRYTINFRGGSEKVKFFVSGAFYQEDGIFKSNPIEQYDANIGLQRFNLRSNVDMTLTKTTQLSVDISGQYLKKNTPGYSSEQIFNMISHFPTHLIPMYYSDGTASDHTVPDTSLRNNPYNMLNNSGYNKQWGSYLQTKVTLNQQLDFITKGLSVKGIVSFDADFTSSTRRSKTAKTYIALGRDENGNLIKKTLNAGSALGNPGTASTGGNKKIYLEASLNYNHTFAEKHAVTGMVLYMQKERQAQAGSELALLPYRKQSVVARATYGYDNRYLLETSFGATGSENFAKGHRWGIFPAVGGAWYISHEKFMKNIEKYISKLKLRTSYGITGNDDIGNSARFPYRETLKTVNEYHLGLTPGANGSPSNSVKGLTESTFASPNLSWEIEKKLNIGIDLGLFDGRVDLAVDYFANKRSDILIQRKTIPTITGFETNPYQNFGITNNKGIDANIILKQTVDKVNLSARGNITYAKNKIIEYDEIPQTYPWLAITNQRIGQPQLYIAEGLYTPDDFNITSDPATGAQTYILKDDLPKPSANVAPGDIKYKDLNNDGVIDAYDQSYDNGFYPTLPQIVYGFGVNAEWKGIFIGVFFQGVAHTSANLLATVTNFVPFYKGKDNSSGRMETLDRWQMDNPYNQDVLFPRMHSTVFQHNYMASTWWYRDASFLRLKNIEIGYEFNKNILKKLHMNNLRLYVQGNNVAVWDKIKYWDPEIGDSNSGARYPICGSYTVGLEVTF